MSRWTVYKAGRYAWTAHREGDLPSELFPTWRMALDYADRMARTREYVLPRGPYEIRSKQHIYEEPIKVEPITHFPGHETVAVKYSAAWRAGRVLPSAGRTPPPRLGTTRPRRTGDTE